MYSSEEASESLGSLTFPALNQRIGEIIGGLVDDRVAVSAEKDEIFIGTAFFLRQALVCPRAFVASGENVRELADVNVTGGQVCEQLAHALWILAVTGRVGEKPQPRRRIRTGLS